MNKRLPLLLSLLGMILLAASLAYWILQLYQPPQRPLAAVPQGGLPDPSVDAAAMLFGGQPAAATATNYQLTGVVAAGHDSVAIIVAEGGVPKALKVGHELTPGITLTEVHPRYVMLLDGGVLKRIDLAVDAKGAAPMGGPGGAPGGADVNMQPGTQLPAQAAQPAQPMQPMPAPSGAGAQEQEPPMSPGPVGNQQPNYPPPPQNPNGAPAQPPARTTGAPVQQNSTAQ